MDDEQVTRLALAAAGGCRASVEAFVSATQRDVWRFVAHLTDVEAADDLAQETFLRALNALPSFAGRSSARTWLLSIARRTVVDRYRSLAVRPRRAALAAWEEVADHPSRAGRGFEDGLVLNDLLAFLPAQRREAFVLTQVVGLTYAEVAAMSGCPVGTVRSRVARARDELVRLVRAAEAGPEAEPESGAGYAGPVTPDGRPTAPTAPSASTGSAGPAAPAVVPTGSARLATAR
ncbi:sigma-70 family RNA polymerase sigma factor [Kitasatospora herbaricolor]|uniref:RNA polymerase sigma factor n=1 Tax=Kitasatospora herbaricolor TaxID=68217 RepID=A0ABZ1W304_9ACTN|nr:sigma-70 family RNA polymerase sigma factor [Kitasatospora herbaricolor]